MASNGKLTFLIIHFQSAINTRWLTCGWISAFFFNFVGLQFSVTPSPIITTLQSAVFSCTVNVVVPIGWTVNETSSADSMFWESYISSYGIVADGVGTQDTTLTIPGDPVLNGTVVQCRAVGVINNELYNEVNSDTLYIQGV